LDDCGYPQSFIGDQIILEPMIVTVTDIVEAMASHRPYRPALAIDLVLDEIKIERGSRVDKTVVDACQRPSDWSQKFQYF